MRLKSNVSAEDLLEYFNHFHDSFVKKFSVASRDRFTKRKLAVMYDIRRIEIRFAHWNYAQGNRPSRQIIRAVFSGVEDVSFSVMRRSDTTVMRVDITEQKDGDYGLTISYPDIKKTGKLAAYTLFTFRNAVFNEIPRSEGFPLDGMRIERLAAR